ncbi:Cytochrome P450 302a1 [Blattella germanica]|nr:Cytochrome P450 302a1 [Blattella germanica]
MPHRLWLDPVLKERGREYNFDRLHHNGHKKLMQFGPIVREEIVPGVNVVWIFSPSDIERVFRNEGRYPERRSHLALQKYRQDRPQLYNTGGLLPTNGPEWWKLRTEFQRALSRPQNVRSFLPDSDHIIQEFVTNVKTWPLSEEKCDFTAELSRLFLECLIIVVILFIVIGLVTFDIRLGSLEESERYPNSRSSLLINAAFNTNTCILATDNGPQLWRWIETRLYKKLRKSQECLEEVALDLITKKKESYIQFKTDDTKSLLEQYLSNGNLDLKDITGMAVDMLLAGIDTVMVALDLITKKKESYIQFKTDDTKSLLEQYLSNGNLDLKDITGMAVDMLLAGIDTTTYTSCFALYHLATNTDKQKKLYEESCRLLPDPESPITTSILAEAQYTKAVIKETFRLNPISVGIGRILPQDTIFSGYCVPKGTVVVTQNQVACRLEEHFSNPNKFIPERWLKDSSHYKQTNPFLVIPFGHGPRTCIARWLAEQNMYTLILRVSMKVFS